MSDFPACVDCGEPDSGSCPEGRCRDCDIAWVIGAPVVGCEGPTLGLKKTPPPSRPETLKEFIEKLPRSDMKLSKKDIWEMAKAIAEGSQPEPRALSDVEVDAIERAGLREQISVRDRALDLAQKALEVSNLTCSGVWHADWTDKRECKPGDLCWNCRNREALTAIKQAREVLHVL